MAPTTRIPLKRSIRGVYPGEERLTLISKLNNQDPILSSRWASSFRARW